MNSFLNLSSRVLNEVQIVIVVGKKVTGREGYRLHDSLLVYISLCASLSFLTTLIYTFSLPYFRVPEVVLISCYIIRMMSYSLGRILVVFC
jgi:hypothetical protein